MTMYLLQAADNDGFTITGGEVLFVLVLVILLLLAIYLIQRIR
jgi:hypothetical protein